MSVWPGKRGGGRERGRCVSEKGNKCICVYICSQTKMVIMNRNSPFPSLPLLPSLPPSLPPSSHAPTIRVLFTRVVAQHPPIDGISKLLIHPYGQRIGHPHKQIHKISMVPLIRDLLQQIHHQSGAAQASEFRRDRDRRHVPMPTFSFSLSFSHNVGSETPSLVRCFFDHKIFGPCRKVLQVEPQIVRLREDVEVDVVETEEVLTGKATQGALVSVEYGKGIGVKRRKRWTKYISARSFSRGRRG